jgi:hypothetical protein
MVDQIKIEGFKNAFTLPNGTAYMDDAEFSTFEVDPEIKAVINSPYENLDFRKLLITSQTLRNPDV